MKYLFLFLLSFSFLNCTSEPTANAATTPDATPSTVAEPPVTPQLPTLVMAELLPLEEAKTLINCSQDPSAKQDDREYSTSVTYSCTDPFSILSASLVWKKDGTVQDASRRDNNPALEKLTTVPGADSAHLMAAQGRLMVAKGTYLLTVQIPGAEAPALSAIAAKILAQL